VPLLFCCDVSKKSYRLRGVPKTKNTIDDFLFIFLCLNFIFFILQFCCSKQHFLMQNTLFLSFNISSMVQMKPSKVQSSKLHCKLKVIISFISSDTLFDLSAISRTNFLSRQVTGGIKIGTLRMHVRLAGQSWDFLEGHLWPKRGSATNNRKFPIFFSNGLRTSSRAPTQKLKGSDHWFGPGR